MRQDMMRCCLGVAVLSIMLVFARPALAVLPPVTLDENCTISILNRKVQVQPDGTWAMPNVPSSMGRIRARATCVQDGVTHHGQSDYFSVIENGGVTEP